MADAPKQPPLGDPRDYILDLSGLQPQDKQDPEQAKSVHPPTAPTGRPFLSVHFKCCGLYSRIFRTADEQAYAGHCPRCSKPVRVKIAAGGTSNRCFEVE